MLVVAANGFDLMASVMELFVISSIQDVFSIHFCQKEERGRGGKPLGTFWMAQRFLSERRQTVSPPQ